jgi:hypothetical protein
MARQFRRYVDISAQAINVRALMTLFAQLERRENLPGLERMDSAGLVPFVVFMAFAIESYLNSLGFRHVKAWEDLERLPWKAKTALLHEIANKAYDWGVEPLQFAKEVFSIRDRLAHGKPERIYDDKTVAEGSWSIVPPEDLWPDWYKAVTLDWLAGARSKFRQLMIYLGDLFGHHESDHLCAAAVIILRR